MAHIYPSAKGWSVRRLSSALHFTPSRMSPAKAGEVRSDQA